MNGETFFLVVFVSVTSAALTSLGIWVFWLRHLRKNLLQFQQMLVDAHEAQVRLEQTNQEITQQKASVAASDLGDFDDDELNTFDENDDAEDGREVERIVLNGRVIEVDANMSDAERESLIKYLKAEGFIP